jgi:hypothetical protein
MIRITLLILLLFIKVRSKRQKMRKRLGHTSDVLVWIRMPLPDGFSRWPSKI